MEKVLNFFVLLQHKYLKNITLKAFCLSRNKKLKQDRAQKPFDAKIQVGLISSSELPIANFYLKFENERAKVPKVLTYDNVILMIPRVGGHHPMTIVYLKQFLCTGLPYKLHAKNQSSRPTKFKRWRFFSAHMCYMYKHVCTGLRLCDDHLFVIRHHDLHYLGKFCTQSFKGFHKIRKISCIIHVQGDLYFWLT